MANNDQKKSIILGSKQGMPIYRSNPSVPSAGTITRRKAVRMGDDKRGLVIDTDSGEMLSVGGAAFYEFEEVDSDRFVKMFLAGIKQATGLSKAGLSVFELVYREMQNHPGEDEIKLSFIMASELNPELTDRTYRRGIRELLEKEFLFRSPADGVFFINIRYMFNGDRLAFVKGYKRKSPQPSLQSDLFEQDDI